MNLQVIVITIIMFFLLVGVHEWGHLYFAKRAGILVREFAIGFGPKVFSYRRGETQYTFRLIPFGGYIRMAGEDPEDVQIDKGQTIAIELENGLVKQIYLDEIDQRTNVIIGEVVSLDLEDKLYVQLDIDGDEQGYDIDRVAYIVARGKELQIAPLDRHFSSKTVGQRAMTIFAGPMMNGVLSLVLFFVFVLMAGVPIKIEIGSVTEQSAAEIAGLQQHDIVIGINGEEIGADRKRLIQLIEASPEQKMQWSIVRNEVPMNVVVTPQDVGGIGKVGIGIASLTRTPTILEAVRGAWHEIIYAGELIVHALQMLVTLQLGWDDLGGPVRMVEITGEAVSYGMATVVSWAAFLSLYLGIFNLLPFPALDGSRLMFIGLEAVRGKPVNPNRESLVHFIGFAMIMMLMIIVTYNDILRLFKG